MSGTSRTGSWIVGLTVLMGASLMLLGTAPEADARWSWNKDCDEIDDGGGGHDDEDRELREPKSGLQLDPLAPPQYVTRLEQPERMVFQITAWNDSWRSQAASAVVVLCQAESHCTEHATDLGDWAPMWALDPGERRNALIWSEEPVGMGLHTVTVLLIDDVGTVVDRYHGDPLMVGRASVQIVKVEVGERKATARRSGRVKSLDPNVGVALTVKVVNEGNAPEFVSAAFVVDGGTGRSCGRELYTPAVRVAAGEREELTTFWADDAGSPRIEAGRHILSVLLYDSRDAVVDARRGIPIKVRSVER